MMRKLITICFLSVFQLNAQDVHLSQFWNNSIQYNPSLTGLIPANFRASVFYKNQWTSVGARYDTYGANIDYRIETNGSASFGIGLDVYKDVAGDLNLGTTNAQLALSSILEMNDYSKISIGVKGGILQKGFDLSQAQWGSQYNTGSYDPTLGSGENINSSSEFNGDLSAGITYVYSSEPMNMTSRDGFKMRIGVAYNHILRPKYGWTTNPDQMYANLVAHIDMEIGVRDSKVSFLPAIITQFQGPSKEILFGTQIKFMLKEPSKVTGFVKAASLNVGAFYRWNDAIIPSVAFEFDHYSIGISYDTNISSLTTASRVRGGLEFSLMYRTPSPFLWQRQRDHRGRPKV